MSQSYQEYLESVWSEEHQGFPWWMEPDDIKEQKWTLTSNYTTPIADCICFTEDMPKLNKHEFQYVFVYGTLKRGKSNHAAMKRGCEFITEAHTVEDKFVMKETKQGRIPVVLSTLGANDSLAAKVRGEVYLVETKQMPRLDQFEQNGVLYRRVKITTQVGKIIIPAWIYLGVKKNWQDDGTLQYCHRFSSKKDGSVYFDYVGHDTLAKGVK